MTPTGQDKKSKLTYCEPLDTTEMFSSFKLRDDLGPEKSIFLYGPSCNGGLVAQFNGGKGCYEAPVGAQCAQCAKITTGGMVDGEYQG